MYSGILSERISVVKLRGKAFNISNIVVYATTARRKKKLKFYCILDNVKGQCKLQNVTIVLRLECQSRQRDGRWLANLNKELLMNTDKNGSSGPRQMIGN